MGYIHTIQINGTNSNLIEPILFSTIENSSDTTALAASIPNFELVAGVTITIQMTFTNAASATLSINGTAKPIYYKGAAINAGILKENYLYNLTYDGNVWNIVGEKIDDNDIKLAHKLTFGAGGTYIYDGSDDITVPVFMGTVF